MDLKATVRARLLKANADGTADLQLELCSPMGELWIVLGSARLGPRETIEVQGGRFQARLHLESGCPAEKDTWNITLLEGGG